MKTINACTVLGLAMCLMFITACGGGGVNSGSGTVSLSVTDAKPLLPEDVTNLFVEFLEVWVHQSGGGWQQLELVETPYTIDLLQFHDGEMTELVPPAILDAGKYTQVRFYLSNAIMRRNNDETTDQIIQIPSENLKTEKNFTIDLADGTAVNIVIHFDLSMSIVPTGTGTYQMKPVLHLFEGTSQAAVVSGSIDNSSFDLSEQATVTILDGNDEVYTKVEVEKTASAGPAEFSIFWLVPNQIYTVQLDLNQDGTIDCNEFEELIPILMKGEEYTLNRGIPIVGGTDFCTS